MANLFDPPKRYTLPLVKGQDLAVTFENVDPETGDPLDFEVGTTATLTIDATSPVSSSLTIDDATASLLMNYTVTDPLAAGLLWRLVLTDSAGLDVVVANGKTARYDGA